MIARDFGLAVITRVGSNPEQYVNQHPILRLHKDNIQIVPSDSNCISSTEVRKAVKLGQSITDWVPESVSQYIEDNKLYTQRKIIFNIKIMKIFLFDRLFLLKQKKAG